MSVLAETLLTAFGVSGLAAATVALLPGTPARAQLAVAAAGIASWIVPWGAIHIALLPATVFSESAGEWPATAHDMLSPLQAGERFGASSALTYAFAVAMLIGFALFVRDCLALQSCLRRWRARSRAGAELHSLLPPELAGVAAEIRIVEDSATAAVSGWLRPTIWIGARLQGPECALALTHEAWHVRARDPLWLMLIAAMRRLYWWNPLVAYLARHAVLMIESRCDHRCARQLGKAAYVVRLASMLLAAETRAPRLAASLGTANLAVQRLRLLEMPLRLRISDIVALGALVTASVAVAATAVIERADAPSSATTVTLPATPAGDALAALLRATNASDTETVAQLLGAWTPQEVPLPLPSSTAVRVLEVLRSEPLRIEYLVESRDGARYLGALSVTAPTNAISTTRLEPLH